jgi:hypothetical protein
MITENITSAFRAATLRRPDTRFAVDIVTSRAFGATEI